MTLVLKKKLFFCVGEYAEYGLDQQRLIWYVCRLWAMVFSFITLHYITLHYITLHYITLHYITLHYITLPQYITLHHITSHHITLHYTTLHCTALHCVTLHITIKTTQYTHCAMCTCYAGNVKAN